MRNWKRPRIFCTECNRWLTDIQHRDCPKGTTGSLVWLDIENFENSCNKCNKTWPTEDGITWCGRCGHKQKTVYEDSAMVLEVRDEIIATDGDELYILRESGEVVVTQRQYYDLDWDE